MNQGVLSPSAPSAYMYSAIAQQPLSAVRSVTSTPAPSQPQSQLSWVQPTPQSQYPGAPGVAFRQRLIWTTAMEDTLIASLLESVRAGLRADSSFKKSAWVSARAAVQTVSSTPVTIRHCTTKYDTFKKDWKQWNALVSQSGFTFDETGRVMGDEGALDEYFKRYPLAAKFRLQPLRAADTLRQLFSGHTATGSFVVTPEELAAGPAAAESVGDSRRRRCRRSSSSSSDSEVPPRRRRRARAGFGESDLESQLLDSLSRLVGQLTSISSKIPSNCKREAMDLFMDQYGYLHNEFKFVILSYLEEERQARLFAVYSPEMRRDWVERTLRQARQDILDTGKLSVDDFAVELARV
ncbi:hypothetical protein yc1106_10170 [Curvularia clavata]|uniref:Myb/SANT-like domain-containing protein n=1 Tax=Curvularia clavata TaxID=95742 RepID=A0A9Q9DYQ9_CURCL|nr:hypothetical protein yc1106_10170 [Curvularia clavata]